MSRFRFQVAVSLDGYMAGPDESVENPLGVGGMALHEWMFGLKAWRRLEGLEGATSTRARRCSKRRGRTSAPT